MKKVWHQAHGQIPETGQDKGDADPSQGSGQQLTPGEGGGVQVEELAPDSIVGNPGTEAKDLREVSLGRQSQRNKAGLA